jgi:hypothetical protein
MSSEISINSYLSDSDSSDRNNSDFDSKNVRVCKIDKNIFVQTAIISYDRENLKNDTLWEQFKKNFVDWIENDFKSKVLNIRLRRLRNALRKRDVWILKDARIIIAKFLIRILEKEHFTFWIEEEIVNNAEKFKSDVIDHLRKTNFDRNLINYLWQTAQSRSKSQKSKSARQSSLRERSTQKKFFHHSQSLNKKKIVNQTAILISIYQTTIFIVSVNQTSIIIINFWIIEQTAIIFNWINQCSFNQSAIHQMNSLWKILILE